MTSLKIADELSNQLKKIQDITIGVFMPKFSNTWELVIEDDNRVLKTLSIGTLFGLHTSLIDSTQGKYIKFPDNKTLSEMMEDPIYFYKWWNEVVENIGIKDFSDTVDYVNSLLNEDEEPFETSNANSDDQDSWQGLIEANENRANNKNTTGFGDANQWDDLNPTVYNSNKEYRDYNSNDYTDLTNIWLPEEY